MAGSALSLAVFAVGFLLAPLPDGPGRVGVVVNGRVVVLDTFKPPKYRDGPLIVVCHGMLRNADTYRDNARGMADRFGALVVAPLFDQKTYPNEAYQSGGILKHGEPQPADEWTVSLVPKVADAVRRRQGRPKLPYYLIGHSAGGQFLSRLAAFTDSDARRVVVSNPSSHVFPTRGLPFPYGFGNLPDKLSDDAAIRRYLARPVTIYLGTADTGSANLDQSQLAKRQGANRHERGQACFEKARDLAKANGWAFNWRLVEAPGVEHDAKKMFDHEHSAEALFGAEAPASLAGFEDSGTFHLYKDSERLVTIEFTWKPDGTFENRNVLTYAGQTVRTSFQITPDKAGRWERIEIKAPGSDVSIVRKSGSAERTMKGKTETITLKPNAVLFERFGPALFSQAVRAYDRVKGGKQTIPLIVLPGAMTDLTLEAQGEVERAVGGRDLKLRRYLYSVGGVDITLFVGADDGKLYLADVPSQQAAYVRAGFEGLRQSEEKDPLLSKPEHTVKVERGVGVPMRDGVKLSTDVYRPEKAGKYPVILIRTPYKKEVQELDGMYYARRGYAVAVQDCRGRFGSPGAWEPFVNEPQDGHDAIEWLAAQPWSTGKVGMIGGSYVGWVQWWAAAQKPPHLVTIIPNVSPPDPFYNFPYDHGVLFLWGALWWADVLATEATGDVSGVAMEKIGEKRYGPLLRPLPVIDLDKRVLGKENPFWRKWVEHPTDDDYWGRVRFQDKLADVRIPVFHQSGWFDGDGIGSKLNYLAMARHGHPYQKLVLGPWGHTNIAFRTARGRDFGPEAIMDLPRAYLRWFDHWLKGVENVIDKEPLVSLFVMGSNRWAHGPTYPLPETRFDKWYLASGGRANTSNGDGRLTREPPAAGVPPDRYTYDPGDPTPDPDFSEGPEERDRAQGESEKDNERRVSHHAAVTAARRDILVYVSEPMKESYTLAGPVSAVLYAATTAKDTDWFVRLLEVDEKGKVFPLVEGKVRARFRRSMSRPELLEPGKVTEYQLDLWQTGITIPAGRRLRVEVASASFPMFSRNLNTGGHNEKETEYLAAEQTIYHSQEFPSHVLLPAIPEPKAKKP